MKKSRFDQAAFGATVTTLRRASLVQGFRRPDQGFRRHAADIDAVPPMVPPPSATRAPWPAAVTAAEKPAEPAPMMARYKRSRTPKAR
jgi:hypothetical protein